MADKLTTRQKLLHHATKLFALNGYSATSIRNIANNSGVNLSMISYHFGGKDGLYKAVIESQLDKVLSTINSAKNEHLSPIERLRKYVEEVKNIIENNENFASLIMMEFNNPSQIGTEITQKYFSQFYTFIADTIIDGVNSGEFRNDINIEHIIFCFVGILSFYNIIYRHFQSRTRTMPMSDKITTTYLDDAVCIFLEGVKAK